MEFDFLPNLPKSNLDDRKFEDLVQECLLRIPRYCPEWTHHNPSDPGITIVELFAYLTDQMLLRFNQVPRRNYITFLELLGIRLKPPIPARTELSFYLTQERHLSYIVEAGTEVATERTENEEAVVFSTAKNLVIGNPKVKYFFTAEDVSDNKIPPTTRDLGEERLQGSQDWEESDGWRNKNKGTELFARAEIGSCFYLVLDHEEIGDDARRFANEKLSFPLCGNIIALTFKGETAAGTGINPNRPPRIWQAWDSHHKEWVEVLHNEADDRTDGFNFANTGNQGADVILHLPTTWQKESFSTYEGYWIRCIHRKFDDRETYKKSPKISFISSHSIGGTVAASQCVWIKDKELLGISNGRPGQSFSLQNSPVLERNNREFIVVMPPGTEEILDEYKWKETIDFGESQEEDPHYVIDDLTGQVQFGPLILEPGKLRQQTRDRKQAQDGNGKLPVSADTRIDSLVDYFPSSAREQTNGTGERQHGKVPPKGYEIYMMAYRTGGGLKGNVQEKKLTNLMVARSYIKRVINHQLALGGVDAQSIDDAVMRVPAWLRTQERAITEEDFEYLAKQVQNVEVHRARCIDAEIHGNPGEVQLLVIPKPSHLGDWNEGLFAKKLDIEPFREDLQRYIDDRKPLGVKVAIEPPNYVCVKVDVEVFLTPNEREEKRQREIRQNLLTALYQFLNPVTGGIKGAGWPFGHPVYRYEIADCCQKVKGVSSVTEVKMTAFRLPKDEKSKGWELDKQVSDEFVSFSTSELPLTATEVVCSWKSSSFSHRVYFRNSSIVDFRRNRSAS